jgi:hypothetical protein
MLIVKKDSYNSKANANFCKYSKHYVKKTSVCLKKRFLTSDNIRSEKMPVLGSIKVYTNCAKGNSLVLTVKLAPSLNITVSKIYLYQKKSIIYNIYILSIDKEIGTTACLRQLWTKCNKTIIINATLS